MSKDLYTRVHQSMIADQMQFSIVETASVVFMDGGHFIERQPSSSPQRSDSTNKARF
jgi:hypothetical protein